MTESTLLHLFLLQTVQVTVVIATVWLINRLIRHRSPHITCALWLVVLLKCVTPPLWASPAGLFCRAQEPPSTWQLEPTSPSAETTELKLAVTSSAHPTTPPTTNVTDLHPAAASDTAQSETPFAPASVTSVGTAWIVPVWLGGILAALLILLRQLLHCRRLLRSGTASPALQSLVDESARQLRLRRPVRLRVTPSNVGPAVTGVFRPMIVLPEAIVSSVPASALRPVIVHELIHVRRGDLWLGILQSLSRLIWWFHPLVHAAVRQTSRSAEVCCDQESLEALGCPRREYADCLLTILEQKKNLTPVPVFPGVRAVDVTSTRLEQIMNTRHGSLRTAKWRSRVIVLLTALLVLPGASLMSADDRQSGQRPDDSSHQQPSSRQTADTVAAAVTAPTLPESRLYEVDDVLLAYAAATQSNIRSARRRFEQYLRDECQTSDPQLSWLAGALMIQADPRCHRTIGQLLTEFRVHGVQPMELCVTIGDVTREQFEEQLADRRPAWFRHVDHHWPLTAPGTTSSAELWPEQDADYAQYTSCGPLVTAARLLSEQQRDNLQGTIRKVPFISEEDSWCRWCNRHDGTLVSSSTYPWPVPSADGKSELRELVTGYRLRMRPVLVDNRVVINAQLQVAHEITANGSVLSVPNPHKPPRIRLIRMSCEVQLRDDQTAAITGESYRTPQGEERIPVLMLTPVLGDAVMPASHQPARDARFSVRAYQVADLVVPKQQRTSVAVPILGRPFRPATPTEDPPEKGADFTGLVDMITTVLPGIWDRDGGEGAIAVNENTLSLVIRQSASIHDRIIDLLEELRRVQGYQIRVELSLLRLSEEEYQQLEIPLRVDSMANDSFALLDPPQSQIWQQLWSVTGIQRRTQQTVTINNGEQLSMQFSSDDILQLHSVSSVDRRTVRFTLASIDDRPVSTCVVPNGDSVLIDVTYRLNAQIFPGRDRVLMCLTPRIIVVEEEELAEDIPGHNN